ncbi:MAG: type 1 glutamine amidotransferase [Geobacteraceae bacterium]|nr:type 1 glutamine amidotransferase [Geobacteraceae bacterium]
MLHIIQNDPQVPPGNIQENLPFKPPVRHPYRGDSLPDLAVISALIVLGGAMGANDDGKHPFLHELKSLISRIVSARIPFLGICLGGQLMATATGGRVISGRWKELGTMPVTLTFEGRRDRLFRGIPGSFSTFQWHHDSFDTAPGGVILASSATCPHQSFRMGECAWGIQFHPEVTEEIIRDWCAWDESTASRTRQLVAAFKDSEKEYRSTASCLLRNFLAAAGLEFS